MDDVFSILKWENLVAFFAYMYQLDEQILRRMADYPFWMSP